MLCVKVGLCREVNGSVFVHSNPLEFHVSHSNGTCPTIFDGFVAQLRSWGIFVLIIGVADGELTVDLQERIEIDECEDGTKKHSPRKILRNLQSNLLRWLHIRGTRNQNSLPIGQQTKRLIGSHTRWHNNFKHLHHRRTRWS